MTEYSHAYIGIAANGELALFISREKLTVLGPMFLRGNSFPKAVYEFGKNHTKDQHALEAISSTESWLRGDERTPITPTFGEDVETIKRRRKKK